MSDIDNTKKCFDPNSVKTDKTLCINNEYEILLSLGISSDDKTVTIKFGKEMSYENLILIVTDDQGYESSVKLSKHQYKIFRTKFYELLGEGFND